jgi:hypothetical protein
VSDQPQASRFLIYQAEDGAIKIDVRFEDETVWQSQPLMAQLFGTTQQNVSLHLQSIYDEGGLQPAATHMECLSVHREVELRQPPTVQNHLTVRQEGARQGIRSSERRFYQKITDVDATRICQSPIPGRAERRARRDC